MGQRTRPPSKGDYLHESLWGLGAICEIAIWHQAQTRAGLVEKRSALCAGSLANSNTAAGDLLAINVGLVFHGAA